MAWKLIDGNEVCEMLGISKSTLYRWSNLSDNQDISRLEFMKRNSALSFLNDLNHLNHLKIYQEGRETETPNDFPRAFKIGRIYKWSYDEIDAWIKKQRV